MLLRAGLTNSLVRSNQGVRKCLPRPTFLGQIPNKLGQATFTYHRHLHNESRPSYPQWCPYKHWPRPPSGSDEKNRSERTCLTVNTEKCVRIHGDSWSLWWKTSCCSFLTKLKPHRGDNHHFILEYVWDFIVSLMKTLLPDSCLAKSALARQSIKNCPWCSHTPE